MFEKSLWVYIGIIRYFERKLASLYSQNMSLNEEEKNVYETALELLTYGVTERTVIKKGITVTHQASDYFLWKHVWSLWCLFNGTNMIDFVYSAFQIFTLENITYIYAIYGRTCLDGYLTKKLGIVPLLYVHIWDYSTIFEVF